MRIAVITSGQLPMPPVKGGAVQTLIEMYLAYNETECLHEFTVYSIGAKGASEAAMKYDHTKFEYVNTDGFIFKLSRSFRSCFGKIFTHKISKAYISAIDKRLKRERFDVCIIENSPSFILDLTRRSDTNYILHLHNDSLNKNTKFAKKIADSYDRVFAVSDYIANRVKEIKGSCKVLVLHNAVDLDRFNLKKYLDSTDESRARYGLSKNDIVILYTGRLKEKKGIHKLLEAFVRIKDRKNLKLVIAGSVFYKQKSTSLFTRELERLAGQVQDRVIFTGYIDYDKIPELYAIADIGVVPSIWEEPFGLTVIEHMAMGNALITTKSGAIPEIVDGSSALFIERSETMSESLSKAIIKLSDDREARKNMTEAALERVTLFNRDNYNKKFFAMIDQLYRADEAGNY
jgi:spore coat protein SA